MATVGRKRSSCCANKKLFALSPPRDELALADPKRKPEGGTPGPDRFASLANEAHLLANSEKLRVQREGR